MLMRLAALAVLLVATPVSAAESVGGDRAFSFVALGDMPYRPPEDIVKFDRLIAAVNRLKPAFTFTSATSRALPFPAPTRSCSAH